MTNYHADLSVMAESAYTYQDKIDSGFFKKYMSGKVLDIGYKGYKPDAQPVLPDAIGVDFGYPGYDGKTLPFESGSIDAVYSSHCLEHIADYTGAIMEWFRVLKVGGYIITAVPHMYLYEKKSHPPSNWNADHKRFYTASRLLREFEETLPQSLYRVVHLQENWKDSYNYSRAPWEHSEAPYEIEVVIKKVAEA